MIELAIRLRRKSVPLETFLAAKTTAVAALVSQLGIGPEREFEPFRNEPEERDSVYVGMTRYSGHWSLLLSMFSPRLLRSLPKFIGMQAGSDYRCVSNACTAC